MLPPEAASKTPKYARAAPLRQAPVEDGNSSCVVFVSVEGLVPVTALHVICLRVYPLPDTSVDASPVSLGAPESRPIHVFPDKKSAVSAAASP